MAGVVAISVLWPRYAYLPMGPLPNMTISFLAAAAACGCIVFRLLQGGSFRRRFFQPINAERTLVAMLILWYAWRVICDLLGENPSLSFFYTFQDATSLAYMFVIGAVVAADPTGRRFVFRTLILVTVIVCLIGVLESRTQRQILTMLGLNLGGLSSSALSQVLTPTVRDGVYRARSVFAHPIVFGQFAACMAPLAWHVFRHDSSRMFRLFALAALALIPAAIYLTHARSGFVALAAAVAVTLGLIMIRKIKQGGSGLVVAGVIAVTTLAAAIAASGLLEQLVQGRTTEEVESSAARQLMFERGTLALEESPVSGYGEGAAVFKAGNNSGVEGGVTLDNYYINIAVDFGYLGLLIFFVFAGVFFYRGYQLSVSPKANDEDAGIAGSITASAAALLGTMTILSTPDNMSLFYFYVALLGGLAVRNDWRPRAIPVLRPRLRRPGSLGAHR
ncbi:MAG: O-antigen ligase family protein [Methylocella sp.]